MFIFGCRAGGALAVGDCSRVGAASVGKGFSLKKNVTLESLSCGTYLKI